MKDDTAKRSAAPAVEPSATEVAQSHGLRPNWVGLLVLLPGLCTLMLWELAAWQWPAVARLVSQPTEIARGIVDVVSTGTIWQHLSATLTEMAVGYPSAR